MILTGAVGTGKTAVAQEVVAAAHEFGMSVAAIDLDWLGWLAGGSVRVDEMISRNLASVASNYLDAGVTRLVLARALVESASLQSLEISLLGWHLTVINLRASRSTLEQRLRGRDSGTELEEHLAEFPDMARRTDSAVPGARVVINEDRTLRDVAIEVMRIAEWIE